MPARTHFICTVQDCGRVHFCRGYCRMHWLRWYRHGDPLANLPNGYKDLPLIGHPVTVEGEECWAMPLSGEKANGRETIVDLGDRWLVDPYRWHCSYGYAARHEGQTKILLHQMIIEVPDGCEPDHKNRNRLDNRRCNLRPSRHFQNCFNGTLRKHKTSRYRGVFWASGKARWTAKIRDESVNVHLGHFRNEEDAARAWNLAVANRGEFALFNEV